MDGFYSLYVKEEFETRSILYLSTNTVPANLLSDQLLLRKLLFLSTNNFASSLADFLGVCQITAPGKLFDWETRATYMPLVTAGQKPVFVDATTPLRRLLEPAFNPRQIVYLPVEAKPSISVTNQTQARIISGRFSAHRVVFETEAEQPSLVVAAQTFYPCWKAYVDGQPARLWHANHAFQAFQIPAGRHTVELIYQDGKFLAGITISGLTLLGCLASLVRGRSNSARNVAGYAPG